jgi:hypothetical protein
MKVTKIWLYSDSLVLVVDGAEVRVGAGPGVMLDEGLGEGLLVHAAGEEGVLDGRDGTPGLVRRGGLVVVVVVLQCDAGDETDSRLNKDGRTGADCAARSLARWSTWPYWA